MKRCMEAIVETTLRETAYLVYDESGKMIEYLTKGDTDIKNITLIEMIDEDFDLDKLEKMRKGE